MIISKHVRLFKVVSLSIVTMLGFYSQPTLATPTCEQRAYIQCTNNWDYFDAFYSSVDECVEKETELRCAGTNPDDYNWNERCRKDPNSCF